MGLAGPTTRPRLADVGRARITLLSQLILAPIVIVGALLALLIGEERYPSVVFLGVVLGFVALATAVVIPAERLSPFVTVGLALLDITMIGLLRIGAPVSGFGLLWVIPVIGMTWSFGLAGAVPTAVVASAAYVFTSLLDATQQPTLSLVLFPLFLAGMTAISYLMSRRADAQRDLLDRQSQALRRTAERARSQEELVTDVLDAVDFGVVRLGPTGEIEFSNEAYSRLWRVYERTGGVIYAADGHTLVPESDRPITRVRRGERYEAELMWLGPAGADRRAVRFSARRIRDARGEEVGSIVVVEDVTAEQLALRAREDLIASVSHELRTPLTSILGYLELTLEDESLSPDTRRRLEVAERGGERLLSLVADILTTAAASRSGSKPAIDPVPVDLSTVVRAAVEEALPRARERRMTIDASGVEPAEAWADVQRIRQVVDNLVTNAIKYADEGGLIEVGCTSDGQQSWIVVRDDGPGISAEEQPQLFEPYFRSDSVRQSTIHGNGLGLAISRDIARAHGGEITVRSTLGNGAAFLVRLPATNPKGE
ncbi:MAG: ATP-binding protein [Actinobacteria bacterium]|nr:ATP-binding protein [Actinomycetota bacterium]